MLSNCYKIPLVERVLPSEAKKVVSIFAGNRTKSSNILLH